MVEKRQWGECFINLRPIKNCHNKLMTTGAATDRKKHTAVNVVQSIPYNIVFCARWLPRVANIKK